MKSLAPHTDTAPDQGDTADTGTDTPLLVSEMVAQQMRTTTTAIYRYITYISLWVLLLCSAIFAAVQVWALRGYLPDELPSPAAWALPIALQVLVLAAELILLSSAVTRSWSVQVTAATVMAIGYGAEITAHLHKGKLDLLTITFVVMSALLALCWTLLALALRAGITDADAIVRRERGQQTVQQPAPQQQPTPAAAPELAPQPEPEPELVQAVEFTPAVTEEPEPMLWEMPQTPDTASDLHDTPADTPADTVSPQPGIPLSDIEMDAVMHMIVTETDPPRSYREMEARYRELGYVGGAARLRESWSRVTQPAAQETA
ncbi:hypothetical protein D8771_26555 [Streptomyces albus]|uniref:DUF2637 domain-containing protein n=1 Tax=Streptomyces albus TaxID=1888 RepID=A0A8H1QLS7_9ACTN|nr:MULTISPECIES: hypothetical protein [Streptomyces]TGG77862.1 hypothetical protein D8771_26555 [Streptomyces albus]TXJ73565.1 hypothetical protein E2C11_29065 [Streptomyces lavendulae]